MFFLHFPFSTKTFEFAPVKPEILSCCSEYLAATKANQKSFSISYHHLSACNHWRNKGLRHFAKLFPNSGTSVAISNTVWIYVC